LKTKTVILFLILAAAASTAYFAIKPPHSPTVSQRAFAPEDFELVGADGHKTRLSDMKGSVVFVNFWATWCGSCVGELPSIERLFRSLSGYPSFKMVTILYKDSISDAVGYMKQSGYNFPVFTNPGDSAAGIFGITGVPET
jgi:thiol-disulfide isomerase/thioredoxin